MKKNKGETAPEIEPSTAGELMAEEKGCPVETAVAMAEAAMPVLDGHAQPLAFPHSDFPDRYDRPFLPVQVPIEEQAKLGNELNEALKEKNRLEAAKKSAMDRYKGEIATVQERIEELQQSLDTKTRQVPVDCKWVYETAGIDQSTGDLLRDTEKKTLIRLDTFEIVKVEPITEQERQMSLPLAPTDEESAPAESAPEEAGEDAAAA